MEASPPAGVAKAHPYPREMPADEVRGPSSAKIWTGLVTVYFFWGTTYLAIDRSNQTIPPLVGPAIRFLVAGTVLMLLSRLRGDGGDRSGASGWARRSSASC